MWPPFCYLPLLLCVRCVKTLDRILVTYISLLQEFLFSVSIHSGDEEDKRGRGVGDVERRSEETLWVTEYEILKINVNPKGKRKKVQAEEKARGKAPVCQKAGMFGER